MYVQARPLKRHDAEIGYWFAASNLADEGKFKGKIIHTQQLFWYCFYTIAYFWTSYWFENILGILSNTINLSDTYCSICETSLHLTSYLTWSSSKLTVLRLLKSGPG